MEARKSKEEAVRWLWTFKGTSGDTHVHAANTADSKGGYTLVDKVFEALPDVQAICGNLKHF